LTERINVLSKVFFSAQTKRKNSYRHRKEECAKFNSVVGIRVGIIGSEKEEEKNNLKERG